MSYLFPSSPISFHIRRRYINCEEFNICLKAELVPYFGSKPPFQECHMKIGLLGLIASDLTDVYYIMLRLAAELGSHGVGAHVSVPADIISQKTAAPAKSVFSY